MIADKGNHIIEPHGHHDRAAFSCGKDPLDRYIKERASQDVKRDLACVFVFAAKEGPNIALPYYSLSNKELKTDQLPSEIAKKTRRYGYVGVTLLRRLAVVERCKGTGLGALVLMEALPKSLIASRSVASWAVFVEAIDDEAVAFYRKYGFIELPEDPLTLFLPIKTVVGFVRLRT